MSALKWLVINSEAGSTVNQHGNQSNGTTPESTSVDSCQNETTSRPPWARPAMWFTARLLRSSATRPIVKPGARAAGIPDSGE